MQPPLNVEKLNHFILSEVIGRSDDCKPVQSKLQQKHFKKLYKNIKSISGEQAKIFVKDSFDKFKIEVQPNSGLYKGGTFLFTFKLPRKYPNVAPSIVCDTPIYHPNIDDEGAICLSLLDEWEPSVNDLLDCIQGLLFLLQHPNLEDPLSPFITSDITFSDFCVNVKKSLAGFEIDGFKFEKNYCLK